MSHTFVIKPATKYQRFTRGLLYGVSGGGKTRSALEIACVLQEDGRTCVIDTEWGRSSLYAPLMAKRGMSYDVLNLCVDEYENELERPFDLQRAIDAIAFVEAQGYRVCIFDGASPIWAYEGGALQYLGEVAARAASSSNRPNTFNAWDEVNPLFRKFIRAILRARMHMLVTLRVKTRWEMVPNAKGGFTPTRQGLEPIFRQDTLDYELDWAMVIGADHVGVIDKTYCDELKDRVFDHPGAELGEILLEWSRGEPPPELSSLDLILADVARIFPEFCQRSANWKAAFIKSALGTNWENGAIPDPIIEQDLYTEEMLEALRRHLLRKKEGAAQRKVDQTLQRVLSAEQKEKRTNI